VIVRNGMTEEGDSDFENRRRFRRGELTDDTFLLLQTA
jgi:hypothetical protein